MNTAKRIESTATARGQIVVGPKTYDAIREHFTCTPQAPVPLKGKQQTIQTYIVNRPASSESKGPVLIQPGQSKDPLT